MYNYCECGHPESDHADFGLRRCAKRGCACDQYIEDDDVLQGEGQGLEPASITAFLGLIVFALIILIECMGKPTEAEHGARVRPPMDSAIIDSVHSRACPEGCKCNFDGTIKECPDVPPPGGPK